MFSVLLILASQRIEVVIAEWFQNERLKEWLSMDVTTKRGATPTMVEWAILSWVAGNYCLLNHRAWTLETPVMEFFSARRWTTGSAQQSSHPWSSMYELMPSMCCMNFRGLIINATALLLGLIQPSPPSTKEFHAPVKGIRVGAGV